MRDIKTRAAMEQPKTRQQNAIPRTAVRILQRHYAQQKQERQTQHQRQPVEYATEQAQQGMADTARLTFRATRQLQRKYVLHKYRAQKVRQRQETTAAQVCQRDMWQSTEQTAAAQHTATVPRQPAKKPPATAMTAAQQRAKQHTQRAAQRQMLQQTKAAARKAGQRLEQMAQVAGKTVRAGIEAIAAAGGGVVLFLLLFLRGMSIAVRARDKFGALLAVGFVVQVVLQAVLNIAVVTNTIPNTGISLPFFSSGGTSLMMLLGEMGIVLSVSRQADAR